MRKKNGYTLTEVMVVLTILTVMIGLAVPSYTSTMENSRMNEAITAINIIHMGEKIYKLNNGVFWGAGTQTAAAISAALNVDINPTYYTTFTFTSSATTYTAQVNRNATMPGGNTAHFYKYDWNDTTKALVVTKYPT